MTTTQSIVYIKRVEVGGEWRMKTRERDKYQRRGVRKSQGNDDVEWVEGYKLEKEAI